MAAADTIEELTLPSLPSGLSNYFGDDQLKDAYYEFNKSGSMMPIIKQELKILIQSRRLSEGQGELQISFEEPKKYELTDYEKTKLEKRRETNRRSATKCRRKKKETLVQSSEELTKLQDRNRTLHRKCETLMKEKQMMLEKVNQALNVYQCTVSHSDTISLNQVQHLIPLDWNVCSELCPN